MTTRRISGGAERSDEVHPMIETGKYGGEDLWSSKLIIHIAYAFRASTSPMRFHRSFCSSRQVGESKASMAPSVSLPAFGEFL